MLQDHGYIVAGLLFEELWATLVPLNMSRSLIYFEKLPAPAKFLICGLRGFEQIRFGCCAGTVLHITKHFDVIANLYGLLL